MKTYAVYLLIACGLIGLGYVLIEKIITRAPGTATPLAIPSQATKRVNPRHELVLKINPSTTGPIYSPSEFVLKVGELSTLIITNNAEACAFIMPDKNIDELIAVGEELRLGFSPTTVGDIIFYCAADEAQVGSRGVIHVVP